jgi:hypothetical protein
MYTTAGARWQSHWQPSNRRMAAALSGLAG